MDAASASAPEPSSSSSRDENDHGSGDGSDDSNNQGLLLPEVIPIDPAGDLILDVTFETSKSALRAAARHPKRQPGSASASASASGPGSRRPAAPAKPSLPGTIAGAGAGAGPQMQIARLAFRVDSAALRRHSRYFDSLLGDARFREGREVAAALAALALETNPRDVDPARLPRVAVVDDDQATRYARREAPFADLLRALHGVEAVGAVRPAPPAPAPTPTTEANVMPDSDAVVRGVQVPEKQRAQVRASGTGTVAGPGTPDRRKQQSQPQPQQQEKKSASANTKPVPGKKQQQQQKQKTKQPTPTKDASAAPTRQQHQQQQHAVVLDLPYMATLAVLADRFDCAAAVSRWLTAGVSTTTTTSGSIKPRFKWPATSRISSGRAGGVGLGLGSTAADDATAPSMTRGTEEALRQKILVAWVLDLPARFQAATREIIMNGSRRWGVFDSSYPPYSYTYEGELQEAGDDEEEDDAIWWYLPDGLEEELQHRRACVLNTVGSLQQHFLALYASRGSGAGTGGRQCKLGYDSSAACDSYQLGEMVKFLTHKGLLSLIDFSPRSLINPNPNPGSGGTAGIGSAGPLVSVEAVLAALRQCPAYQVDKHHSNCGLRARLLPLLDFVQGLLSAGSVPLARAAWARDRGAVAWLARGGWGGGGGGGGGGSGGGIRGGEGRGRGKDGDDDDDSDAGAGAGGARPFRFTRSMLGDQRLRFEHALGADKFARAVFTATSWDWTAED